MQFGLQKTKMTPVPKSLSLSLMGWLACSCTSFRSLNSTGITSVLITSMSHIGVATNESDGMEVSERKGEWA